MAQDTLYLTVGRDSTGRLVAIMSAGQPQFGDENCVVLAVEVVKDKKAAREWFDRMKVERPWATRH